MPPCPFKVLSVPKTATINDIKLAYRKLAMQLHPDRNGGDTSKSEMFKKVSAAYETLSNPTERKRYESEQMWQQQWPPGVRNHPQWNGGFHSGFGPPGGKAAFNEEEWMAYHFGINMDDFDFDGPETVIFTETSSGRMHMSRTAKKQHGGAQKKGKKKGGQGFSTTVKPEDFENIMGMSYEDSEKVRRARSSSPTNKSKGNNPGPVKSGKKKSNRAGRGKGKRLDSDCIVS